MGEMLALISAFVDIAWLYLCLLLALAVGMLLFDRRSKRAEAANRAGGGRRQVA